MSRQEYVRYGPPVVDSRACIVGRCKQTVLKRVGQGALLVADRARNQSHHSVGYDSCRKFSAGEHIVADRDFAGDQMLANAVVYAFVMSAEYYDIFEKRETVGERLGEHFTVRRSENHLVIVALGFESRDRTVDRLDLHDHAGCAAERVVVDFAVAVGSVVAQVVYGDSDESLLLGAFQNGAVEGRLKHLGQYGKYVYSHYCL